jgi:diguanylate cyclase (GGDEF)-like protein
MAERSFEKENPWIFIYRDERAFLAFLERWKSNERTFCDSLTGLFSRAYFESELKRLDTPRQLPLSVVIADVNKFKLVNDVLGHEAGDEILRQASQKLKGAFRQEDIVARWGGDEFAVLLPQTSYEEARGLLSRFSPFTVSLERHCHLPVSFSFGVATKSQESQNIKEVLEEAERAMYHEKTIKRKATDKQFLAVLQQCFEEKVRPLEPPLRTFEKLHLGLQLGKKLSLSPVDREKLWRLLFFHDLGKVTIPEELLKRRKEELSPREWKMVVSHSEVGYRIASQFPELTPVAEAILSLRERWDGTGYPRGLKGKAIPLLSRIGAIIGNYEAMVMGRPYRAPLSRSEALEEIWRNRGKQFDPEIVPLFLEILKEKKFWRSFSGNC